MQDEMLAKCSKKGRIGAKLIHVLLRGSAGQGLAVEMMKNMMQLCKAK